MRYTHDPDEYAYFVMEGIDGEPCVIYLAPIETRPLMLSQELVEVSNDEGLRLWCDLYPNNCFEVVKDDGENE